MRSNLHVLYVAVVTGFLTTAISLCLPGDAYAASFIAQGGATPGPIDGVRHQGGVLFRQFDPIVGQQNIETGFKDTSAPNGAQFINMVGYARQNASPIRSFYWVRDQRLCAEYDDLNNVYNLGVGAWGHTQVANFNPPAEAHVGNQYIYTTYELSNRIMMASWGLPCGIPLPTGTTDLFLFAILHPVSQGFEIRCGTGCRWISRTMSSNPPPGVQWVFGRGWANQSSTAAFDAHLIDSGARSVDNNTWSQWSFSPIESPGFQTYDADPNSTFSFGVCGHEDNVVTDSPCNDP